MKKTPTLFAATSAFAMYGGHIDGVGPGYCLIEDKVRRVLPR